MHLICRRCCVIAYALPACLIVMPYRCASCWRAGMLAAGTVAKNDQLDLLAEFMGVGDQVAAITSSVRAWEDWLQLFAPTTGPLLGSLPVC
jgi:hypothetical protein